MEVFKKISDTLKQAVSGKSKKKLIENAVIIIIIGIIIIIAGGAFFDKDTSGKNVPEVPEQLDISQEATSASVSRIGKEDVEKEVEDILSQIEGAGKVNVMITYVAGKEVIPAYNTKTNDSGTDEKDSSGGTRKADEHDSESNIAYEEAQGGTKAPIILKELQPVVKGVVIVADGAGSIPVRERLSKAVQVLMDIPIHKIQVFARKK